MYRIFAAFILTTSLFAGPASAAAITEAMVKAQYDQMEDVLNNREDAVGTIQYLHAHISEDASFKLSVTSPEANAGRGPVVEMDKTDYINTYIQGTHFVDDYSVDIQTLKFEQGESESEAYTLDVMTERGLMTSEMNNGKPFVSRTTCRTRHEIDGDRLVATAGECHTDISFEEEI